MARIRLNRVRFNPIPDTKSTQSRYFLGYFVFVDEPDVGYAVSVRAAGPQGALRKAMGEPPTIIRDKAQDYAQEAAQRLSDRTQRQVAFIPVLPQATKREAVEHLYGGEGSWLYGGPHATASVTLSRTRLPNRDVVQTQLASIQAHWSSLYGDVEGVQTKRRAAFATPAAYDTEAAEDAGYNSMRFTPQDRVAAEERARLSPEMRKLLRKEARVGRKKQRAQETVEQPISTSRLSRAFVARDRALREEEQVRREIAQLQAEEERKREELQALAAYREVYASILDEAGLVQNDNTLLWIDRLAEKLGLDVLDEEDGEIDRDGLDTWVNGLTAILTDSAKIVNAGNLQKTYRALLSVVRNPRNYTRARNLSETDARNLSANIESQVNTLDLDGRYDEYLVPLYNLLVGGQNLEGRSDKKVWAKGWTPEGTAAA